VSEFRDDDLYGIEGPNTGRIQDKLRDPARLKNWWDQYALEAADRIDWLERELTAATRDRDEARAEVERLRNVALHLYKLATTDDGHLIDPTCEGCIEAMEVIGGVAARKEQS